MSKNREIRTFSLTKRAASIMDGVPGKRKCSEVISKLIENTADEWTQEEIPPIKLGDRRLIGTQWCRLTDSGWEPLDGVDGECYSFQPGDGTCYDIVCVNDPHGGVLVIWPGHVTYRYHRGDRLKHLHGDKNKFTDEAIKNFMDGLQ